MDHDKIPAILVQRIERLINKRIEATTRVSGGYTPALRLVCKTANTSFFAKVGVTPLTSQFLQREIKIYHQLSGDFMPGLVAWDDDETAPILIIEDLSTAHWPPPWDEGQIELALRQIEVMHALQIPLESYQETHGLRGAHWAKVAADPAPFLSLGMVSREWLERTLPVLESKEAACSTTGNSVCHMDIRSDNLCFTSRGAVLVDWNLACLSNPRLDLGSWLPSLAFEGGPQPESILPDAPEVAAWVSGFFAARAGLPDIPDAPYVRRVQRQQLQTALPWAVRAMDLPPVMLEAGS